VADIGRRKHKVKKAEEIEANISIDNNSKTFAIDEH